MKKPPAKSQDTKRRVHPQVDDYVEIAGKVRTGEYFREARKMFDVTVHDPMAERYLYIFISVLSFIILTIAIQAAKALYPLESQVPLIFYANNVIEDIPRIRKLQAFKDEDPGEAVLRFMVGHYVQMREGYDIVTFDRDVNGVRSQSSEDVVREFQAYINPRNPEGPISQYQRHSRRTITIVNMRRLPDSMEVIFDAAVESKTAVKNSRWRANIAFKYSGIELDEKSERVKPVSFIVTKYHSKRLQDSQ